MKMNIRRILILALLLGVLSAQAQRDTIIVQQGDTFETIAIRYGITLNDLISANPGKRQCYTGMRLVVPQAERSPVGKSGVSSPLVIFSDSLLLQAKTLSTAGQYKAAIQLYDQVIDMEVRRAYGLAGRGECYYRLEKYKKAKADLQAAIHSEGMATQEKEWCSTALQEVEKGLSTKRDRQNRVWANIGLAVASTAAVAATAYAVSEQNKAQQAAYQGSHPSGTRRSSSARSGSSAGHLERSDQIIAQSQREIDQMLARGQAQMQMYNQQMVVEVQQAKRHIEEVNREQLRWAAEFNEKNGRYPTEAEMDRWLFENHRDIWMLNAQAKADSGSGDNANSASEESSSSRSGGMSADYYVSSYKRNEHLVEMWFNNLTLTGYKGEDRNGNVRGKTNGEMKSYAYIRNQSGLKKAQAEMRKVRLEAEKHGVHIQESKWETATVRY